MNFTVFIGCDFAGHEPYRTLKGVVESLSKPDSKVYPILSNTDNDILREAFGESHPEIRSGALFEHGLGLHVKALIRNCDFAIFDVSGYKGLAVPSNDDLLEKLEKQYCLNVIHEIGIATAFAGEAQADARCFIRKGFEWLCGTGQPARRGMDASFFARKGLDPIKDISNLQGALPLTYNPYKSFNNLKEKLESNLEPLIWLRRQSGRKSL